MTLQEGYYYVYGRGHLIMKYLPDEHMFSFFVDVAGRETPRQWRQHKFDLDAYVFEGPRSRHKPDSFDLTSAVYLGTEWEPIPAMIRIITS